MNIVDGSVMTFFQRIVLTFSDAFSHFSSTVDQSLSGGYVGFVRCAPAIAAAGSSFMIVSSIRFIVERFGGGISPFFPTTLTASFYCGGLWSCR
jgi:hypothetical protein